MTIAMAASLIAGSTYAIFTSESKTNIAVNAGKVKVVATAEITDAWSALWSGSKYDENHALAEYTAQDGDGYMFTNGGTVVYNESQNTVNLNNITPGDGVALSIGITNYSNVKTQYRIEVSTTNDDGLFEGLDISYKIGNEEIEFSGENPLYTGWTSLEIPNKPEDGEDVGTFNVSIELPITNEDQNKYQEKSCDISINVFAVQWNGYVEDPEQIVDENADVTVDSKLISKVTQAASKNGISSQSIVFGTMPTTTGYSLDSITWDDGISISGVNAKLFNLKDEIDGYGNTFYVLAKNSMLAAEESDLKFADSGYTYVDLSGVDFSNTTKVGDMFKNSQIETLVMQKVDLSKVTDLESMFSGCEALKSVDFSNANLSNLTSIWSEFKAKDLDSRAVKAPNLESVNFAGADLSGLTTLESAFAYDINLTDVNFSGAILSNVEGMGAMFRSCTKLVSADFSEAELPELLSMSSTDQGQALPNWGDGTYDVGMFDGCYALTDVRFADAQFGKLKDMSNLFHNCVAIQTLTFSEVFSNCDLTTVTDIHQMFYYNIDPQYVTENPSLASHLQEVDLSGMQYKSVKYASGLFHGCSVLQKVDFTGADLSSVTNTGTGMFLGTGSVKEVILKDTILGPAMCSNLFVGVGDLLETVDLSGADCTYVTDMSGMFAVGSGDPTALKSVSFKGAKNLDNVTNMYQMFNNCTALEYVDFTDCNLSNVKITSYMFYNCTSLTEADFTGVDFSNANGEYYNSTGSLINGSSGMASMFSGCESLTFVSFKNAKLTNADYMSQMFSNSGVKTVDFTNADLEYVTSTYFTNIFSNANNLETVIFKGAHLEGLTSLSNLFCYNYMGSYRAQNVKTVDFSEAYLSSVTAMYAMFYQCPELTSVDFSGAILSGVSGSSSDYAGLGRLFYNCTTLTTVNFSGVQLPNLTSFASSTFGTCSALTTVNFSGANLSSVSSLSSLFSGCTNLQTVEFTGATFGTLTSLANMFQNCTSLTSFDFSEVFAGIDLSAVTSMNYMFDGCSQLTSVDFSNVSLTAVTSMNYMFQNCSSLQELDLSEFDFANVNNMQYTFSGCSALIAIDLGAAGFTKSVRIDYLFQNCEKLAVIYVSQEVNLTNNWNSNAGNAFVGCKKLFELYPTYSTPTSGQAHGRTGNNGYFTVGSLKDNGVPQD